MRYEFGGTYIWRGLYMEGLIFGILRYFVLATYLNIALRNEVAPFNTILIGTNDDSKYCS